MQSTAIALALLLTIPFSASPAADQSEQVTIQSRLPSAVCVGTCVEYDVAVRGDGSVDYRGGYIGRPRNRIRFRMTGSETDRFFTILRPLRPVGESGPVGRCDADLVEGRLELDIRWQGRGPPGRLTACWGARDVERSELLAMKILRIHPTVRRRLTRKEAELYYDEKHFP